MKILTQMNQINNFPQILLSNTQHLILDCTCIVLYFVLCSFLLLKKHYIADKIYNVLIFYSVMMGSTLIWELCINNYNMTFNLPMWYPCYLAGIFCFYWLVQTLEKNHKEKEVLKQEIEKLKHENLMLQNLQK